MMTESVKNGFSTLNRLLGKKNLKDGSNTTKHNGNGTTISLTPTANGGSGVTGAGNNNGGGINFLAALGRSTSNLDMSSQQQNKIVPLQAMNNAPFEQTFRITVCLPRDQLYVARVGAKTRLCQLLLMICESKQLDADKYEFRHPTEDAHIFDTDATIGEVGLNEIRLSFKSDRRRRSGGGGGMNITTRPYHPSSPESSNTIANNATQSSMFVGKHNVSMHAATTSPYSSTNSLNSIESLGSRGGGGGGGGGSGSGGYGNRIGIPVAPMRKKRAAPRPPSQNSIPEQTSIALKSFHVSSPNLSQPLLTEAEMPAIVRTNGIGNGGGGGGSGIGRVGGPISTRHALSVLDLNNSGKTMRQRPMSLHVANTTNAVATANAINGSTNIHKHNLNNNNNVNNYGVTSLSTISDSMPTINNINHSRTSSDSSEVPEPTPRKRLFSIAKKKAPAPPPRGLPPLPTTQQRVKQQEQPTNELIENEPAENGGHSNRNSQHATVETSTVVPAMVNGGGTTESPSQPITASLTPPLTIHNVSKTMLNVVVVVEPPATTDKARELEIVMLPPSSLSQSPSPLPLPSAASITTTTTEIQPSPSLILPTQSPSLPSLPPPPPLSSSLTHSLPLTSVQCSPAEELASSRKDSSSSADDESLPEVNIYNLRLGKAVTVEEVRNVLENGYARVDGSEEKTTLSREIKSRSPSPLWTYTLPAPPKFADISIPIANELPATIETVTNEIAVPPKFYNVDHYNNHDDGGTIMSDSNATHLSDIDIQPVIKERILPLDNRLYSLPTMLNDSFPDNHLKNGGDSSSNSSTTIAAADLITSDIEDGYQGDKMRFNREVLLQTLEKRREQYIENELEFLVKEVTLSTDEAFEKKQIENTKSKIIENMVPPSTRSLSDHEDDKFVKTVFTIEKTVEKKPQEKIEKIEKIGEIVEITKVIEEKVEDKMVETVKPEIVLEQLRKSREFIPAKRRSLTMTNGIHSHHLLVRNSGINRADSFNVVRSGGQQPVPPGGVGIGVGVGVGVGLLPRSSSYVSLMSALKQEARVSPLLDMPSTPVRWKSSGELSISDSPLLQSLEVMKTILPGLNSRKNSVQSDEGLTEVTCRRRESLADVCESPLPPEVKECVVEQPKTEEPEEPEKKQWCYQGPPTINLSTWSERPKSQIAIKSDSDYKFGGSGGGGSAGGGLNVTRTSLNGHDEQFKKPSSIASAPPDVNRLPIVRAVEYKKNVSPPAVEEMVVVNQARFQTQVSRLSTDRPAFSIGPIVRRGHSFGIPTAARPTSFTPSVKGFRKEENVAVVQMAADTVAMPILRPAAERHMSTTVESMSVPAAAAAAAPFSQNTLRRTGLKEKILAAPVCENAERTVVTSNSVHLHQKDTVVLLRGTAAGTVPLPPPAPPSPPALPKTAMPIVKSVVVKKNGKTAAAAAPAEVDTHDQLLNAIRSFNRDTLQHRR